ncbi:hypothetical protein SAMN02746041_03316 [Desulfacinum hydrothermale DSM 13146]|uniref:Uncharacterized protein n=1 Tax=Desulfacinum hydrothermale DSM 13146 TaxID=1121390 RepID=A0A1W1XY54_9BACT|nr:hypothetical protein [Desulfacinum hydrothermale]SMC28787.1 hypothetical protein SAMN02746041_03316 [Desulfacinum hydrothermale DSM 13146]
MRIVGAKDFSRSQAFSKDLYYVGFLKLKAGWIPLCVLKDPRRSEGLDMMLVSRSYEPVKEAVDAYAAQVPAVEQTFVQYLLVKEIANLVDRYGVSWIGELEMDSEDGCGCGCGCT